MTLPEQCLFDNYNQLMRVLNHDVVLTKYVEITQENVNRFAMISFDRQWIHVDVERAKLESPFKGTISHGLFNLSMAAYFLMSGVRIHGVNYGLITELKSARFISAIPVGSLIRGRVRPIKYEPRRDSNQVIWLVTVERRGGILPACVTEFVVRYYA